MPLPPCAHEKKYSRLFAGTDNNAVAVAAAFVVAFARGQNPTELPVRINRGWCDTLPDTVERDFVRVVSFGALSFLSSTGKS